MTRDELEARLWYWLPRAHPSAISAILADVDAYHAAETERAIRRRRVLGRVLGDTETQIPRRLRDAHATAARYRTAGHKPPGHVLEVEREYWRTVKRLRKEAVA